MPSGSPVARLVMVNLASSLYSGKFSKILSLLKLGIPNVPIKSANGFLYSPLTTTLTSSAMPSICVDASVPTILIRSIQPRSTVCCTKSFKQSLIYFSYVLSIQGLFRFSKLFRNNCSQWLSASQADNFSRTSQFNPT